METPKPHAPYLDALMTRHLTAFLGEAESEVIDLVRRHIQWVELPGGQMLMSQVEPGDAMYLTVSGPPMRRRPTSARSATGATSRASTAPSTSP